MNCSHCDKPIDDHEASHQTDACVATVVFGATGWEKPFIHTVIMRMFPLPYSADMTEAWKIVDKLSKEGKIKTWSFCRQFGTDGGWLLLHNKWIPNDVFAPTAQLAICRAALKACLTN